LESKALALVLDWSPKLQLWLAKICFEMDNILICSPKKTNKFQKIIRLIANKEVFNMTTAVLPAQYAESIKPDKWAYAQHREKIKKGEWTYADYLKLLDDGRRYEIIEGILYVSNAPNIDHQFTVVEIVYQIKHFVREHQLGYVLTAPFEVHLSEQTKPVQPDVLFIKTEKWPAPGAKYFEGVPDLIVEVLSPSTRRVDQFIKFRAYEKAQVPEYWIANPKTRSIQVFTLENKEYILLGEFIEDEIIESQILTNLKIKTSSLFNINS
jgi:Uma2 family endonuclease